MQAEEAPTLRERARVVATLARNRAAATERLGRLHPEVLTALQRAGLPQMLKQGSPYSIREFVDVCGILAEGCMSTGWCNFVWGMHNYVVGRYPLSVQEAVWRNPGTLVSASLGPVGHAPAITEEGAVVSGRWAFNSGCDHADWLLLGISQPEGEPYLGVLHKSQCEIDDESWNVIGLRGTGSKDAVCENVRVPAERLLPFSRIMVPYMALLILVIVGPVVGGAQAAVREFARKIGSSAGDGALLRVGEASAEVDAARTVVLAAADGLDADPTPDASVTARIVRDTAFAARLCNRATQRLFEAAGGTELQESRELQRIFRDVTAGCAHARLQWEAQVLPYARMLATDQSAPG